MEFSTHRIIVPGGTAGTVADTVQQPVGSPQIGSFSKEHPPNFLFEARIANVHKHRCGGHGCPGAAGQLSHTVATPEFPVRGGFFCSASQICVGVGSFSPRERRGGGVLSLKSARRTEAAVQWGVCSNNATGEDGRGGGISQDDSGSANARATPWDNQVWGGGRLWMMFRPLQTGLPDELHETQALGTC